MRQILASLLMIGTGVRLRSRRPAARQCERYVHGDELESKANAHWRWKAVV